jgi:hypothetical protein
MEPFIPAAVNNWLATPQGATMMRKFPLNLAALLDPDLQRKIFQYVQTNYIWPQVCERQTFEPLWDKVLKLARINLEAIDLNFALDTRAGQQVVEKGAVKVSDSCIFDAIDRLSNINHFISWKDGAPAIYAIPDFVTDPYATDVYSPKDDKMKAGNALFNWNASNENFNLKHLIAARHHYTYGISLARSEFVLQTRQMPRQDNLGNILMREEVVRIGTTFDPLSVRKCWLNFRLPAHQMDLQPCPFYFEEIPYFATLQNVYNPDTNPFGFANLDKLTAKNYIYASQETDSARKAMEERIRQIRTMLGSSDGAGSMPQVLGPEYSVDAQWTLYPMLPLDPESGDWEKYADGKPVPMARYIMQTFGSNLATNQILLRLQRNFYPRDGLPIYAASHMPDLDSGMYAPCLGELLFNHYKEIVTCTNQFIENKDWVNDPPAWVQSSSPSADEDLTRKGAKIKVNGPNDFGWREPFDATSSTVAMRTLLRDEAQTTSKAVDAILGKAMGGRTSATEASNAYQASMSGITTDINIFNAGISGGFAQRVWDYSGLWFDPDLLAAITGQFGFTLKPEDMWLSIGIQTNVGSRYIASIVRQQNLRYVAESTAADPNANRVNILLELFKELQIGNPKKLVNDGGFEREVYKATMQAQKTYLGAPVAVAPDQDHNIAIKVKTAFIEDEDSWFNKEHPEAIPLLIQQVQLHQQFAMLQMQQMMMQQAMMASMTGGTGGPVDPSTMPGMTPGAANQRGGGLIPSA